MLQIKKIGLLAIMACGTILAVAQKKPLTNEQYFKANYAGIQQSLPVPGKWTDNSHFSLVKDGKTFLVDAKTGNMKAATGSQITQAAATKPSVTLKHQDIFFTNAGVETQLTHDSIAEVNPTLSPDLQYVAYTKNNDLYTMNIADKKEYRLTHDGSDLILNGYASWVYMEEILGRSGHYRAFWWSPDSKQLVYFRSNDSLVPEFIITDASELHGVVEKTRYPKVGDPNPEVKIGLVSVTGGATVWANFDEKEDQYFGTPYWQQNKLLISWMNRLQNKLVVYDVDPETGNKKPFYTETQKTWINLDDKDRFHFLKNGKNLIVMSDHSGWMHLYNYDVEGNLTNAITSGNYTVTGIRHIDEKKGVVYFTARSKENSAHTDYYRVNFTGKNLKRLSFGDFTHSIQSLSPDGSYFITVYSNAKTPTAMALVNNDGKIIQELGTTKAADFDAYEIARTELIRVKSKDSLFDLPMKVTWPLNMEPGKKYPVLVSIYGGPNSGSVMDNWRFSGNEQFYAKEGLIQVAMDHRASGHFGKQGVDYMYHNLGYWEMEDYSTMVQWLIANGQADPEKICITGFSYGGYLSCYALTYAPDVFTHAMAGGSVTDWRLYDSHYTERFMGTPANNPEGYISSSVLTHANQFKGKLLLVHGAIDDNVHLQNSIQFASALQDRKQQFEQMYYSGQRHGIRGNKGLHFQNLKTTFIYKHLLQKEIPAELLK